MDAGADGWSMEVRAPEARPIFERVFIGPRVSLITSGHPIDPAFRRGQIVAAPITIERGVWLCTGVTALRISSPRRSQAA